MGKHEIEINASNKDSLSLGIAISGLYQAPIAFDHKEMIEDFLTNSIKKR